MVEYHEPLKLGKGSAFVKSKLRYLPQTDDVWEVDFQPMPEQVAKRLPRGEPWLGLVVSVPGASTSPTCCSKSRRRRSMTSPGCWPMP